MATCFVPTEEIRKLTRNSFEDISSRLAVVLENEKSKVFGEGVPLRVIGTFKDFVIVGSADGRFAKVQYESLNDGSFTVKDVEFVSVPIYSDENIDTYIGNEAGAIAESILSGGGGDAVQRILGLVPFVGAFPKKTDAQIVEGLVESLNSDRPWKRLFKEKQETISNLIGEELKQLHADKLEPKFKVLVKGTIPVEKHESYRDLVQTAFKEAAGRVEKLIEAVDASIASVNLSEKKLDSDESIQLVITFKAFSEDLLADLNYVERIVTETANKLTSVANLGSLYDVVAEELIHYEVASRFVVKMAGKLC